jgi:hypothetical protein
MRGCENPWSGAGRRLVLLTLAAALAACGGGTESGTGGGPVVGMPVDTTAGGGGPGGTSAPPTSPPDPGGGQATGIEVGGPSLGIPGPPGQFTEFGEVAVGAVSAPRALELRFRDNHAATVVGVSVGGDGSFRLGEDRCSGAELPAGGAGGCAVAVVFGPLREGILVATMTVRMTHTCTATTYVPCSWDPRHGEGELKNYTRTDSASGEVRFDWTTPVTHLRGAGVAARPTTS